jgi:hypothetical protein
MGSQSEAAQGDKTDRAQLRCLLGQAAGAVLDRFADLPVALERLGLTPG